MRKIFLFKEFERAEKGNYPLLLKDNLGAIIQIPVHDLVLKKQYYYNMLDDNCVFKNDKSKSIIGVKGV